MFSSRAGYADAIAGTRHASVVYLERDQSPIQRNGSVTTITTKAMTLPQGTGITDERQMAAAGSDDEIIMVTVRLSSKARRQSYDDALPTRPPKRGFLRRVSTRILPPADEEKWKAVKMPRGDYKRHFAREISGTYTGSEPQRDWDEEDIQREFGMYQEMPVRSILS